MSSTDAFLKKDWRNILVKRYSFENEEAVFCTENNLEQSLHILSEELESFGIPLTTYNVELQTAEALRKLSVEIINAAWNMVHKHRSLMQLHDQLIDTNHRTVNDNVNLKNHVKRLKEDIQKKENTLCEAQEKERRLKVQYDNVSRDLKNEKKEIQKLKKQSQSNNTQHEHEIRRIMQTGNKLQEQLEKSIGTFVSRDKVLQEIKTNHEKELTSYKKTICHLEENNRQMSQEINDLRNWLAYMQA